jgi:hypothetical protein
MYSAQGSYSAPDAGQLPVFIDDTAFDWTMGLGTLTVDYNPGVAGDYFIGAFFDHEIDEATNTFFNEVGNVSGSPEAGQSWEIDEPGWTTGDIFFNLQDSVLDNTNTIGSSAPDDVSMALGWNISLTADENAVINFCLMEILPENIFYLEHIDPDSDEEFYFYSDLEIIGATTPVPEPATLVLMCMGLAGTVTIRRKNDR